MTKPGLAPDTVKVRRRTGAHSDGTPVGNVAVVWVGRGAYGSPGANDLELASIAGQILDATLAVELPSRTTIQPGDRIELRGQDWIALWVTDVRLHYRVGLRRAT